MKNIINLIAVVLVVIMITTSCERDVSTLGPASFPTYPEVFIDGFQGGLQYDAFLNSKLDAFDVDNEVSYDGDASMIITVPSVGDPSGWFAGGAFYSGPRDLSGYNALTFYAKASQVATVGLVGFGNDNSGNAPFVTSLENFTVTTNWQKYIIPIPNPDKLTQEGGLFQYSIGADSDGNGFTVWFDEVQFENLGTLARPQATWSTKTVSSFIGDTIDPGTIEVSVSGTNVKVSAGAAYLDFESSDPTVVSVENGALVAVGSGEAVITAKLGDTEVSGSINVNVGSIQPISPPTFPAGEVISLFSNVYEDVLVDNWNPGWQYSTTKLSDIIINGDDIKQYYDLNFVGIVFESQQINASEMTHFHMNIWNPDPSDQPAAVIIEIVDFGANKVFGGGDDSSHRIFVSASTNPALVTDEWITVDIPISNLTGLNSVENLAQIVISSAENQYPNTVYVDNILFHK